MISNKPLPAGWCEAPLPQVAHVNPAHPIETPDDDTLVSFVPMASVETLSGRLDASNHRPWHEVKKGYTRFQEGDVLFAKITPCMENGKAALARALSSGIGAGSTEFHVVRPSPAVRPELLLHYVLQEEFRKSARAEMTGTAGQLRVPGRFLEEQSIPVPPLPEQSRIVEALESYFTRLDAAVATLERVQRNLKRYRASVLKAAVEGRLVPTEAELARAEGRSYEPASVLLTRILAERRRRWEEAELARMVAKGKVPKDDTWKAKYQEPAAPDTDNLPDLPDGWSWATTDQLFWFVTSGSRGWAKYYSDSGAVFIRIGNLDHDSIGLDLSDTQHVQPPDGAEGTRTRVAPGDVLISITADVGMVALVRDDIEQAYINQHVSLARPVPCLCLPYLAWFLASQDGGQRQFTALQRGATKVGLGLDDIRSVNVPVPPLSEQRRIVDEVERCLSISSECQGSLAVNKVRLQRARQSILKWAFEGRLVDQDPTDEPASALLERIRAERASATAKQPGRPGRREAKTTTP